MAEESIVDGGSQDGYSVPITAVADEASFQNANRNVGGLEKALQALSKVDLSSLGSSIKALAAGAAGVLNFTVSTNFDEVQNLLRAAKAGLDNDAFKRWSSIEVQLGLSKGSITKDLADIYEQMAKIKTVGDLNKDQFLALGLLGVNAEEFIDEKDMTKRVMSVMEFALKSDRDPNEIASLLKEGMGQSFADLYYYLSLTGKSFEELFGKMTVFTDKRSQSNAVAFSSEWGAATSSVEEMGRLLASTFGEHLTPFIAAFNQWVRDYKTVLTDILTFNAGWFTKASRILAGVPQYSIFTDKKITWEAFPSSKVDLPTNVSREGVERSIAQNSRALSLINQQRTPTTLTEKDVNPAVTGTLARQPYLGISDPMEQRARIRQEQVELNKMRVGTYYNEVFQKLLFTSTPDIAMMGFSPEADFGGIKKASKGHADRENVGFDKQIAHAIEKFLRNASPSEVNSFLGMLQGMEGRAVPASQIPELQGVYGDNDKIFLQEDLDKLIDFMYKQIPREATSSIQQTNTMELVFPGVTTRDQGVEVGRGLIEGLGKTLGDAFRLNDLAVGGLG